MHEDKTMLPIMVTKDKETNEFYGLESLLNEFPVKMGNKINYCHLLLALPQENI